MWATDRTVDDDPRTVTLGHLRHLFDGKNRAEAVRGLREHHDFGPRAEQLLILFEHHLAMVVHRDDAQIGPLLLGHHLPRNNLRVVLKLRKKHLIARLQELAAIGVGN